MDRKSSVGIPKTIHLAVDWHHNESPLDGRSAVGWLLECARHTLRKHTRRVRKVETETTAALTTSGRSPGRRRNRAEGCRSGLTEPTTTVLRGRKERTGSSGNVWRNWGYLAELRQARADRWRQHMGRLGSERNSLAQFAPDIAAVSWLAADAPSH